eukprot:10390452-Alexandrium_andersonii.AAC.1
MHRSAPDVRRNIPSIAPCGWAPMRCSSWNPRSRVAASENERRALICLGTSPRSAAPRAGRKSSLSPPPRAGSALLHRSSTGSIRTRSVEGCSQLRSPPSAINRCPNRSWRAVAWGSSCGASS